MNRNGLDFDRAKPPGWRGIYFHDVAGQRHPAAALTAAQACEVIRLHGLNMAHATIGNRFGISKATVSAIVSGRRYSADTLEARKRLANNTNLKGQNASDDNHTDG